MDAITDSMTWVWANTGRQWKPSMLQFMELERVGHDLVTEQQQSNKGLLYSTGDYSQYLIITYKGK